MRGSLLAVVAIAVIAGLGAVVIGRNMGMFGTPTPVVTVPPPVAPPPRPNVVVPASTLFSTDAIDPRNVRTRPMSEEEYAEYLKTKEFVTEQSVVHYRKPKRDIIADTPLKYTDFAPPVKPESLAERLLPGTVAVPLYVAKENSAGGLIAVDDWVDVYLITDVSRSDTNTRTPYTGVLLQKAPVVAKRDTLHSIYVGLPPGEAIPYTIAANPYRASLIEYARTIGTICLVPVSKYEKQKLDALRAEARTNPDPKRHAILFAEPDSHEYKAEVERLDRYARGAHAIGFDDLSQVLNLPPLPTPTLPVSIQGFSGVKKSGTYTFPQLEPARPIRYEFSNPSNTAIRAKPVVMPGTTGPVTPVGTTVKPSIVPVRN